MAGPVHYEIYVRKAAPSPWTLLMATEDRKNAVDAAEDCLRDKQAVAVRVTKETMDPATMRFNSVTVLNKGMPEAVRKKKAQSEARTSLCLAPQDLYAPHARETIGRVLEDWLSRSGVTPFELLHRPDLVEKLEASGVEVQHAIQKVAVPEGQASGQNTHELIRHYQKLVQGAMDRVVKAGRQQTFANLAGQDIAEVARKLAGTPDRAFVMGGVISARLIAARGARAKLDRLMDMADAAPREGAPHALVAVALEQILCELFGMRGGTADIFGPSLDHGSGLVAAVRLVAPREIEIMIAADPRMALLIPSLAGPAERLSERLGRGEYPILSATLTRMVLRELSGQRRLRPSDAQGEIDILRVLATALTATAGHLLTLEEVEFAFGERSKTIVTADFVSTYLSACETATAEARALVRLCENVMGVANKRSAARWLAASVASLKFESELRSPTGGTSAQAAQKLALLAGLQKSVRLAGLGKDDETRIVDALGGVGGTIETEAKLIAQLARSAAPVPHRLAALLRLAAAETGPSGPVAGRAKAEAVKLMRAPDTRAALGAAPESLSALKGLMRQAGMAA